MSCKLKCTNLFEKSFIWEKIKRAKASQIACWVWTLSLGKISELPLELELENVLLLLDYGFDNSWTWLSPANGYLVPTPFNFLHSLSRHLWQIWFSIHMLRRKRAGLFRKMSKIYAALIGTLPSRPFGAFKIHFFLFENKCAESV